MAGMSTVNPAAGETLARFEELARNGIREFANVKTVYFSEDERPTEAHTE